MKQSGPKGFAVNMLGKKWSTRCSGTDNQKTIAHGWNQGDVEPGEHLIFWSWHRRFNISGTSCYYETKTIDEYAGRISQGQPEPPMVVLKRKLLCDMWGISCCWVWPEVPIKDQQLLTQDDAHPNELNKHLIFSWFNDWPLILYIMSIFLGLWNTDNM